MRGVLSVERAIKCSSCGRRSANYARRHSGERLCFICLRRDLIREVKRSFSLIDRKGLGLKIAVPLSPCRLVEGVVLVQLLTEIEKEFSGKVIGVITDEGLLECLADLREYCYDIVFAVLDTGVVKRRGYAEGLYRALGVTVDVIAFPATLDDLLSFFLNNLVYENEVLNLRVYAKYGEVEFIVPMYRILKTDLLAYALASGVLRNLSCLNYFNKPDTLSIFASQLSLEHPELLYRFVYSILKHPRGKRGCSPPA